MAVTRNESINGSRLVPSYRIRGAGFQPARAIDAHCVTTQAGLKSHRHRSLSDPPSSGWPGGSVRGDSPGKTHRCSSARKSSSLIPLCPRPLGIGIFASQNDCQRNSPSPLCGGGSGWGGKRGVAPHPHPDLPPAGIGIYTTRIRPQAETVVPSPLMGAGRNEGSSP